MKHTIKIYIEDKDAKRLLSKAHQSGYNSRGAISKYISKVARENIIFIDDTILDSLKKNLRNKKYKGGE